MAEPDPMSKLRHDLANPLVAILAETQLLLIGDEEMSADVKQALAAGSYTVSWKTSSKDGHPIKGDFTFTVKAGDN